MLEATLKVRVMRDMLVFLSRDIPLTTCSSNIPPTIAVAVVTREGRLEEALEFFKRENTLDYTLAKLGKPYVVFMEGITSTSSATYLDIFLSILTKLDLFSFSSSFFFFLCRQIWTLQWEEEPASLTPPL